jgi:hypothetical protein
MGTLSIKQQNEYGAFARFVGRLGTQDEWMSISSRPVPEPDLLCIHVTDGQIAFELVSLTDPAIAEVQAAGANAFQNAFCTSDPSERIVRNKLHKTYSTNARHIELLIYTDGQIITPDDVVVPTVLPWFDTISHPFKRVWFMGESETRCLWNASPLSQVAYPNASVHLGQAFGFHNKVKA